MKSIKNTFFACLLAVAVLFTAGSSAKSLVQQEEGKRQAFYQKALYEAAEEMSAMQVTLKKLTVTNSKAMETEYFSKVSRYSDSVQNSLSTLPIGVKEITNAMKFVNQAGDFALSMLKKISKGGALTEEDRQVLLSLTKTSTEMCITLGELTEALAEGKIALGEEAGKADAGFENLTQPKEEYPTLLYDGPFSDSLLDQRMKGLGENEVTAEEARRTLADFLEIEENQIEFVHETAGDEKTYAFEIKQTKSEAAVTKRGGRVLYVLSDQTGINENLSAEDCILLAKEFLIKKGFGEMHAAYYRKYDGVITVNLAPVENGIILYPDLIKIEVNMDNGKVVGMEASNYYMNHVKRTLPAMSIPDISDIEYDNMTVLSVRPALIPLETKEKLTYEIHLKQDKSEYLIYRDADTGDEIMLYEVVHTHEGTFVQ
ncbi:MAG: germination protein YpeB [Clostridia bacterium]|nr:germination protein YpeB [Clostridia bacterium]